MIKKRTFVDIRKGQKQVKDICGMGDINRVCQAYIYAHSCGRVCFFSSSKKECLC